MKNLRRSLLSVALAFALLLPVFAADVALPPLAKPPAAGLDALSETELRKHLTFLASEELGGRYTFSPGKDIAARYLASRLEAYGYRGAAPGGSFFQSFDLLVGRVNAEQSRLTLRLNGESSSYEYGAWNTRDVRAGAAAGGLVWAGYGISAPRLGRDDYKGLDVRGKIVVLAPGNPKGVDASALRDDERSVGAARRHGAAGVIYLPSAGMASMLRTESTAARARNRETVTLAAAVSPGIPSATVNAVIADALLAPLQMNHEALLKTTRGGERLPMPRPMSGSAELTIVLTQETRTTQNVVGILEGADAKLKGEYVAFAAHYDHLKTGPDGKFYPGADDDGSGTVAVLNIAQALAAEPPRRSVLIIFHAAEELGLLGARYNTDHAPVVPLDRMVVNLNVDMIGRSRRDGDENPRNHPLTDENTVYLVGSDRVSRELHRISERANADSENFNLDYTYNDPNHPDRIYFRSDHWHYAKHGVPILFYFTGTHEDYHRTSDTVDKIDWTKLARITRLIYETGWRLANLDRRVKLDAAAPAAAEGEEH